MIHFYLSQCRHLTSLLPTTRAPAKISLTFCLDQPQVRSLSNHHSFAQIDSNWLRLDSNLSEEGYSREEISALKREFSTRVMDLNQPVTEHMKKLYKKTFPPSADSEIKEIRSDLKKQLKLLFFKVATSPSEGDETMVADFELKFINQLKMLSALGKTDDLIWYIFQKNRSETSQESRNRFVRHLVSETWERCKSGQPAAFTMIPLLIKEKIVDSGWNAERWVDRFSSLGVEEVRNDLSNSLVYSYSSNNPSLCPTSGEERLKKLRELALDGHSLSQEQYGHYLLDDSVGGLFGIKNQIKREERLSEFQTLIDCEKGIENQCVTRFYKFNGSYVLNAQLTVEERIGALEKRAKKGDRHSFSALLEAYKNNYVYQFSHSLWTCLNLTKEERWDRIGEMRVIDPLRWNYHLQLDYLKGYIEPQTCTQPTITIPLSIEERYGWILENAFANLSTDEAAVKLLRYQLQDNELPEYKSFKDRWFGLFKLGLKGSHFANDEIRTLIEWYNHGATDLPFEKMEIFEILTSLALAGCQHAQYAVVKTLLQPAWWTRPNGVAGLELDPSKYEQLLREIAWSCKHQNLSMDIIHLYFPHNKTLLENLIKLRDAIQ